MHDTSWNIMCIYLCVCVSCLPKIVIYSAANKIEIEKASLNTRHKVPSPSHHYTDKRMKLFRKRFEFQMLNQQRSLYTTIKTATENQSEPVVKTSMKSKERLLKNKHLPKFVNYMSSALSDNIIDPVSTTDNIIDPVSTTDMDPPKKMTVARMEPFRDIFRVKRKRRESERKEHSSGEKELVLTTSETVVGEEESGNKTSDMLSGVDRDLTIAARALDTEVIKPIDWTPQGNYSAYLKLYIQYTRRQELKREAQIAFMCVVSLLTLLTWAVWCSGMCNRKKIIYKEWNFQESHTFVSMADVLKRRWKYMPEESFYEEVFVHDKGTDP